MRQATLSSIFSSNAETDCRETDCLQGSGSPCTDDWQTARLISPPLGHPLHEGDSGLHPFGRDPFLTHFVSGGTSFAWTSAWLFNPDARRLLGSMNGLRLLLDMAETCPFNRGVYSSIIRWHPRLVGQTPICLRNCSALPACIAARPLQLQRSPCSTAENRRPHGGLVGSVGRNAPPHRTRMRKTGLSRSVRLEVCLGCLACHESKKPYRWMCDGNTSHT